MKRIILAIGNDEQRKLCRLYLESLIKQVEIIEIGSLEDLEKLIQHRNVYEYIFSSDDLRQGPAAQVYQLTKKKLTNTLYVLYNQDYPEDFPGPEEFNKENTDYILSNLGFDQFVDELSRITGNKYSREKLYRKIPLTSLYRYNKSLCDVFIRLSDDKFVKVQNSEAYYSRLDLDTYRQRGIKHLYTTDDDFKKFMRWRVLHHKKKGSL